MQFVLQKAHTDAQIDDSDDWWAMYHIHEKLIIKI